MQLLEKYKDNDKALTLLKIVCWRIISFTIALCVSFVYLGEIKSTISLTIILTVLLMTVHYIFERRWHCLVENRLKK